MTAPDLQAMLTLPSADRSYRSWHEGACGLAASACPPYFDPESGIVVAAAGRLDTRAELVRELGLSAAEGATLCDSALLLRAYQRWGETCPPQLYGDWAFAIWESRRQRLSLVRDHYGCTALYYTCTPQVFAFASHPAPLLALNLAAKEMDELYLAQTLVSWPARYGERTIYRHIHRLPPAHALTVNSDHMEVQCYWRLEDVPELRLPGRQDYVEAFRSVFDAAVSARLAAPSACPAHADADNRATGSARIAVTLSGGLDSSAVAATAARLLRPRDERLTAFTSTPRYDTRDFTGQRFGDELPFAAAVCRHAGNIDLYTIDGGEASPLQAIRRMLEIMGEPGHAAGNFYWILDLEQTARAHGCDVLLTGQSGNASVSWQGDPLSQPLAVQLRCLGWQRWFREQFKRLAPSFTVARRRRQRTAEAWYRTTAIQPDFARRLNLWEQWLSDPEQAPARSAREQRYRVLRPGRAIVGALQAHMGDANDIEIRDPTADAQVLAFTLAVPDHIFIDPATGLDRWLIRAAMEGRVPDEVRLNRNRGRQAADLVPRLRACAPEVENALDEIAQGPGASYVDVPHMRKIWAMMQEQNTPAALTGAVSVLTRGIMAGLFVNQL